MRPTRCDFGPRAARGLFSVKRELFREGRQSMLRTTVYSLLLSMIASTAGATDAETSIDEAWKTFPHYAYGQKTEPLRIIDREVIRAMATPRRALRLRQAAGGDFGKRRYDACRDTVYMLPAPPGGNGGRSTDAGAVAAGCQNIAVGPIRLGIDTGRRIACGAARRIGCPARRFARQRDQLPGGP